MAKFCTKCGTPLVDGRCPNCDKEAEKKVDASPKVTEAEETEEEVTAVHENYVHAILNMIKRPVNGMRESVADANSKVGLIMMALEALTSGLFVFFMVDKMVSAATGGLSDFGSYGSAISSQLPSAGGYFVKEILFSLAVSLILSALVLGLMKGMGGADMNWFQSCQIAGLKSLGCSMGWLLGTIGIILELYVFAVIILLLGLVLGNIYFMSGMLNYPKVKKDGAAYAIFLLNIIMAVIAYLFLTQMLSSAVTGGLHSLQNIL